MTFDEWKKTRHMNGIYWGDLKAAWDAATAAANARMTEPDTSAPAIPEGYVLVPVEPTPEMVMRGAAAYSEALDVRLDNKEPWGEENKAPMCSRVAYKAMLAAAPKHTKEPE